MMPGSNNGPKMRPPKADAPGECNESPEWRELLQLARRLKFVRHDIRSRLDETGRYDLPLPAEFPFAVSLFHYSSQHFTRGVTWHERLELFMPLDGRAVMRMGEDTVTLEPGDLLIVDNMKPHHVVDHPEFNSRVVVISFMPEFVYHPAASSYDYAFLVPFYAKVDGRHHAVRHTDAAAPAVYQALAHVLRVYFGRAAAAREASCKAWFLVLLAALARCFHDAPTRHAEFLRQRERVARFQPLLHRIQATPHERLPLQTACRLIGMSQAQFTRQFRLATGMTFVGYITNVRLAGAARRLRHSGLSVAEIAAEAGFSDQGYFDRCFKKSYGQTPREFRQAAAE